MELSSQVLLLQMTEVAKPLWEYGVSVGVIILASSLIWKLIVMLTETIDTLTTKHESSIKAIVETHASERSEWRTESQKREERIVSVCDELIKTIHENERDKRKGA